MGKDIAIHHILSLVDERLTVDSEGHLSGGIDFRTIFKVISTLQIFPVDIAPGEQRHLVTKAVSSVLKKGKGHLTEASFKKELGRAICARRLEPKTLYRFSGWVVRGDGELPRKMRWCSCDLSLEVDTAPGRELSPNDREHLHDVIQKFPSATYDRVRFEVEARSFEHAADLAEGIFTEWRGCVDFIASFRRAHWIYSGIPAPLTKAVAFPIFTVQNDTEVQSWYNVTDTIRLGKGIDKEDVKTLKEYVPWVRKRIEKHFDPHRILQAFRSYCSAVDSSNYDVCLQRLWTTLELLTGTDQSELLISRMSSLYHQRGHASEMLRYYAESRNRIAHVGRSSDLDRTVIDLLRTHVHRAFQANLINDIRAKSFSDMFDTIKIALDDELFKEAGRRFRGAKAERKRRTQAEP